MPQQQQLHQQKAITTTTVRTVTDHDTSSNNNNNNNNKYGITYQKIRQLLKESDIVNTSLDNYNTTSTTNNNNNNTLHTILRQDIIRLDELRRIICQCWIDSNYCCTSSSTSTSNKNSSTSATTSTNDSSSSSSVSSIEKWYTYIRTSRKRIVDQLCYRITTLLSLQQQQQHNYHHFVVTYVRTFWGMIAGTPIIVHSNTISLSSSSSLPTKEQQPILDVQLIQSFVRAITTITTNTTTKQNHQSLDQQQLTLLSSLYNTIQKEYIQPYYDVQYYFMSSIYTICNEIYTASQTHTNETRNNKNQSYSVLRLLELLMLIQPPSSSSSKSMSSQEFYLDACNKSMIPLIRQDKAKALTSFLKKNNANDNGDDDDDHVDDHDDDDDDDSDRDVNDDDENATDDDNSNDDNNNTDTSNMVVLSYQNYKQYKNMLCKVWLALLRLQQSTTVTTINNSNNNNNQQSTTTMMIIIKQALIYLPKHILPIISTPLRFTDFFHYAYSYNKQSRATSNNNIIPLLALEGLFYLMIHHGLEYPNYYKQLYTLLSSSSIYYVKYRITFLKLLYNSLLKNDMLPTHIIAAYTKRLLRQALYTSPQTIMFILTFVSNLIRKHPEMACLIHRSNNNSNSGGSSGDNSITNEIEDVYDADVDDPELCNALQSSLWELNALQHHYYSGVVTLAQSIGKEDYNKTLPYDSIGAFLSISYTTLFEQERTRNKNHKRTKGQHDDDKQVPGTNKQQKVIHTTTTPLAFQPPTSLFTKSDIFDSILSTPK